MTVITGDTMLEQLAALVSQALEQAGITALEVVQRLRRKLIRY